MNECNFMYANFPYHVQMHIYLYYVKGKEECDVYVGLVGWLARARFCQHLQNWFPCKIHDTMYDLHVQSERLGEPLTVLVDKNESERKEESAQEMTATEKEKEIIARVGKTNKPNENYTMVL